MSPRRQFGLILLAIATATAIFGAAPSSAALLCGGETNLCPKGLVYPAKTKFSASVLAASPATIKIGLSSITCKEGSLKGISLEEKGEPLAATIETFSLSACLFGKTKCTSSTLHLPYSASIAPSKAEEEGEKLRGHGNMTLAASEKKFKPTVEMVCGALKCTYKMEPVFSVGGEPTRAEVVKAKAELEGKSEESPCPEVTTFTATYQFTTPEEGRFFTAESVAEPTLLCQKTPSEVGGVLRCPAGQSYEGETESKLIAGEVAFFRAPGEEGAINCNEEEMPGNFLESGLSAAGEGGFITRNLLNNGGITCPSTLMGNPAVNLSFAGFALNQSVISYRDTLNPEAYVVFRGSNGAPRLRTVIGETTCEFWRRRLSAEISNGAGNADSELNIGATWERDHIVGPNPNICPSELKEFIDASPMTFSRPGQNHLYVARE